MSPVSNLKQLRALVLASLQLSKSIGKILASNHIECYAPRQGDAETGELAWFNEMLFSVEAAESEQPTSLFAWSHYDFVILEDSWSTKNADGKICSLESAGRVFASWDNDRGNFRTKKIVVESDQGLFYGRVTSNLSEADGSTSRLGFASPEDVNRVFDPKGAIAIVPIDNIGELNSALGIARYNTTAVFEQSADILPKDRADRIAHVIREHITRPVIEAAAHVIRTTILKNTRIVLVEDEKKPLVDTLVSLTGVTPSPQKLGVAPDGAYIAFVDREIQHTGAAPKEKSGAEAMPITEVRQEVETATGSDLLGRVLAKVRENVEAHKSAKQWKLEGKIPGKDLVVITDILFQGSGQSQTGIDLIREVRREFPNNVHIIAFTGFGNPFVAMSAYHQGADFFVVKGRFDGRHNSLQAEGTHLLLQTLALLCFQRGYMRRIRTHILYAFAEKIAEAKANFSSTKIKETLATLVGNFEQILPQHTLSPHLKQEWQDTLYLLKLAQVPGVSYDKRIYEEVHNEVNQLIHKYDHA